MRSHNRRNLALALVPFALFGVVSWRPVLPLPSGRPSAHTHHVACARGEWRHAVASWYGAECYGNRTADGTLYGPNTWCVAHRTLPLGAVVEIRYKDKTIRVPVKDRGPYVAGREFDLSAAVARVLGFTGVHEIEWRVVR